VRKAVRSTNQDRVAHCFRLLIFALLAACGGDGGGPEAIAETALDGSVSAGDVTQDVPSEVSEVEVSELEDGALEDRVSSTCLTTPTPTASRTT
jgi:hypothetical protein